MILSKTGSLYRQPNLFPLFLSISSALEHDSISSALEHELKTHISGVLKSFSILQQITPCRTDMVRKEGYILFTS